MSQDVQSQDSRIHTNTRVRGMKSHLLSRQEIDEMLSQGDLQRMQDRLLDSPYRHELAEALTRQHGADAIEEAVSRNLVDTFQLLIQRAKGDYREVVSRFLQRWDLAAVKSLLRARHHNLDARAGSELLPGPRMTVALLHDLAEKESMETLVTALVAWDDRLCGPLARLLPAYQESGELALFEEALDRQYFVENAKALAEDSDPDAEKLRTYLGMEIDRINLRTVFQHVQAQGEKQLDEEQLLPNGLLRVNLLREMAAQTDVPAAVELLAATPYSALVQELYPLLQTGRFSPVERFLERAFMQQLRKMARQDLFGLGIVMHFAWLKYNEAINLRMVARGLAGHLPIGRVREELIYF